MDSWVLPLALVVIAALAFTLQRMRHTQRQLSRVQQVHQHRAVRPAPLHKGNLLPAAGRRASSARKQAVRTRIPPAAAL